MREHYGVEIPVSSIRTIVEKHANIMDKNIKKIQKKCVAIKPASIIVGESDGSMVPLVDFKNKMAGDRRKARTTLWAECRLSLAYAKGEVIPKYAATFDGVDETGKQLRYVTDLVGRAEKTKMHFTGDGALWIANQVEKQFGSQANYLIDFYHLSEYLHKAAQCCFQDNQLAWAATQKQHMKNGEISKVISELETHINETDNLEKHECEAKTCYNYMIRRMKQFNYADAIANDLPIGSGEIESAHRSIIQKRLKIPGGWWLKKNAQSMVSLRVVRANEAFEQYWSSYRMSELITN